MTHYMVKCDECKRIVRYTDDILDSYAGTICPECRIKMQQATDSPDVH